MKRISYKFMVLLMLFTLLSTMLSGCSKFRDNKKVSNSAAISDSKEKESTRESEAQPTAMPTAIVETVDETLVMPTLENNTGKVLIQVVSRSAAYKYNSYIITSSKGESVVVDPTEMPMKYTFKFSPAAVVITHSHDDHTDPVFLSLNKDSKLIKNKKTEINTNDFKIYTVLSSHLGDTIASSNQNSIAIFEVDGLRIAHMGDIGQTKLTEEQLKEMGDIDILFMQIENSYSDMSLENEKGFNIIEQLNPKIIIPTHYTDNAIPALEAKYGKIQEYDNILEISKEDLPEKALNVYRIINNLKYE